MMTSTSSRIVKVGPRPFAIALMALVVAAICTPSALQSVHPVFVDAPANLTVTGASSTGISLSWSSVPGASIYEIERSDSVSGPFLNIFATFNTTVYTDTDVTNLRAYVYRVRAVAGGNVTSEPSNMAVGTAISFEFDQLQTQRIKAQHFYDVRTAINAVRAVANMPAAGWARPILNDLTVKAADVIELRSRLGEALAALAIPVAPYADSILNTGANGTLIRAIHIEQLQARSTRGSSNSAGPLFPSSSRAIAGEFGSITQLPLVPVHLSVLPDRRILFWGRDMVINQSGQVKQEAGKSEAYVWNMATNGMQRVANVTTNLFCSGHSFLPNGNLFVTGGHRSPHFDAAGEAHTNIFNYASNSWTAGPVMNHGRWYPYNVTLGTGEPLIMAGSYWDNEPLPPYNPYDPNVTPPTGRSILDNVVPQVYTPGQGGGLRDLAAAPDSRLTQYPYLHLLSDGKVFQAQSGFFANSVDKLSRLFDPKTNQWSALPSTLRPHAIGTSALFGGDNVLLIGGFANGGVPTQETESINLTPGQQTWALAESMKFRRTYHTATVLPDGKVLVTGGVSCPGRNNIETYQNNIPTCSAGQVLIPELWDPQTGHWTMMAPQQQVRAYHSVAALLPDGRVLVGGGGLPGAVGERDANGTLITNVDQDHARLFGHSNVEIYSPPYLFDSNGNPAARPVITSPPPASVTYGETFFVGTSGAGNQPKVSLVRLSSVTHGTNQDQRLVSLNPVLVGGGLLVTAPTASNECPPGYYMLFVLNAGVPSVAEIVRVQNTSIFPSEVPVTTASGAGQTWEQGVEFSSSVDGQITHIKFWKAPGEPAGGHVGRIWTAAGVLLASAQFFNETTSGWQEAQLQTPLPITANVRYKVTYNVNTVIAKTFDVFNNPITSGPLVGWGSSFSTPAGSFPTTGSTSNLFADVRFK
jgi:Domain of unknown function (DUF4082)/Domain of unknown function (DUF1929)